MDCVLFDASGGSLRRQEIACALLCKRQRSLSNTGIQSYLSIQGIFERQWDMHS